jgi:glycosyltransferase involved in cell wall biosynthesis
MQATFCFGSSDDSGAGRMGFYFVREFHRRGWRVSAICPQPVPGSVSVLERLKAENVEVEVVPAFSGRLDRVTIERFERHLVHHGARLVVSMHQQDMKFAGFAARRAGVPYVASGQNTFTFSGGWLKQVVSQRVLGWILNHSCREVVATSRRVASEFRHRLRFRGAISIQPNGVDTQVIRHASVSRDDVREALGYPREAVVFVCVGRITRQKNQLVLVEAFARAFGARRPFQLLLVGGITQEGGMMQEDQQYERSLRERIAELGLVDRVRLTGWTRDVPQLLAASDVYVQASLWEGSPLAVVEGMAAGLPSVVTDCGGVLPDFMPGVHGWVIPAGNLAELAATLAAAGQVPHETRTAMGFRARDLAVGTYDASQVAGRFFAIASRHVADSSVASVSSGQEHFRQPG